MLTISSTVFVFTEILNVTSNLNDTPGHHLWSHCTGIDVAWIPGEKMCTDSNKLEKSKQTLLLVTLNDPQSRLNILAKQLSLGTEMQTEIKFCLPLPYVAVLLW